MKDLCPSQSQAAKMLRRLQTRKSETPNFDAKETLNLKEDGDCASFIRHIAALANTGQRSYLFIGVEDKTWVARGIPAESPLLMVDSTQQQINQILAKKLDPPISVSYCVYEIDGVQIGIVGLNGKNLPYVVSIEDARYGGPKTRGKESYIYRGVIYVRRGTESVPANRQSEIFSVINGKVNYWEIIVAVVFIGLLVSIGVGVGASLLKFPDLYVPTLLGSMWGMMIGWMFHKRLADALGSFPANSVVALAKNVGGVVWGGGIGGYLGYVLVRDISNGKMKIFDPVSMGFFIAPISAFAFILIFALVLFDIYEIFKYVLRSGK